MSLHSATYVTTDLFFQKFAYVLFLFCFNTFLKMIMEPS